MNPKLQVIANNIEHAPGLTDAEKKLLLQFISEADKKQALDKFKLDRLEHDKHTLSIMLEESIQDLQKKSRAIEEQNHELEIESSLEKVRAVAMGMRKRDDMLDICQTISQQLESLGIKEIRNVQTAIFHKDKGTYVNYEYYRLHDKALVTEVDYTKDELSIEFAAQMIKGGEEIFTRHLEGDQVKEWLKIQKATNVFIDTHLEAVSSLTYHWFSLGPVAIGTSTYASLTEEQIALFKRFRNVFDLAYRRYLDIEKAEAQAREAQIQLALERVRARTMAMQKSDELPETAAILFEQFKSLGQELMQMTIGVVNEAEGVIEFSVTDWSGGGAGVNRAFNLSIEEPTLIKKMYAGWKENKKSIVVDLTGKQLEGWINYRNKMSGVTVNSADTGGRRVITSAFFSKGHLSFSTPVLPASESIQILERFAQVFDLTYTRFLDLQKAEAQARESQIQLALERVRARTMAMQKSDELSEAVYVLFQQFKDLGERPDQATIGVVNEEEQVIEYWVTMYGSQMDRVFKFSIDEPYVTNKIYKGWKEQKKSLVIDLSGQDLVEFTRYRESMGGAKHNPDEKRRIINVAFFSKGLLNVQSSERRSEESVRLLERFASVFDQTYTRFLDLQKAEAQVRESQIQLALERVRARTMAMQKSDELTEVAELLFKQVNDLGIKTWTTGFNVWSDDNNFYTDYITNPQGGFMTPYTIDATKLPVTIEVSNAKKRGDDFFVSYEEGESLAETYRQLVKFGEKQFKSILDSGFEFPSHQYEHFVFGSKVSLMFITYNPVPDAHDMFKRFGKVFEQTYTRFLDLQTAEAQAKESQIQLALERVRARTMAMQKSGELNDVASLLFKQLTDLGIKTWTTGFNVWSEDNNTYEDYITSPKGGFIQPYIVDTSKTSVLKEISNARKTGDEFFVQYAEGESLKETYIQLAAFGDEKQYDKMLEDGAQFPSHQYDHFVFGSKVSLMFITYEPVPEAHDIFKRFGKVFEQTYTRFLDLQKAEMQARESQIQLALERVRARTMAMYKSEELADISFELVKQIQSLGVATWHCAFNIYDEGQNSSTEWGSNAWGTYPRYKTPREGIFLKYYEIGQTGQTLHIEVIGEDRCANHYAWLCTLPGVGEQLVKLRNSGVSFPTSQIDHVAYFRYGYLLFITYEPVPEAHDIFRRFASVFEQTYTRFLDLQKAEGQAREAQIESALEKVRSRSLAMHKSDELQEVVHTVFERLKELNVHLYTAIIIIFKEESKDIVWWMQNRVNQQYSRILIKYSEIPYLEDLFEARENGEELFSKCYFAEEKKKLYDYLFHHTDLKNVPEEQKKFLLENEFASIVVGFAKNTAIHLTSYSERSFLDEEKEILKRFAKVFDQAYTRFLDLQKAEAQAREAQIETALEKVRSRTLAMQKSEELAETASVLFKQLILLGIEPNRLYINIIKDETGEAEFWITDEDGSKIAMAYQMNMNSNHSFKAMYGGWKAQKRSLVMDMQGDELQQYLKFLSAMNVPFKGGLSQKRRVQYLAYFNKGFIGMASPEEQPAETMQLLERFAAVFNLTFTRFNDLKIAEAHALQAEQDLVEIKAARKKAEDTLTELQAAQKQLVQSEKMASLGELTAGIAHEIQNPLNFVNNFSDVSNELLEEMKVELEKGNKTDVIAIVDDIKQNLEKILYHGKRADSIVKGMLQHSRTSSGQKEVTDINALADEYLRLAYHGLRAKDKSFNAKFITEFDENVGKISVIPQEIGRVMLNLINNAFYAVTEKKRQQGDGYEPTVRIITRSIQRFSGANNVQIEVIDNGDGIPQKNLDKIFQPFFTTKPTGQGTGLGLSLAYDIVKAHGGEIKIETKENEGSNFIIELPSQ